MRQRGAVAQRAIEVLLEAAVVHFLLERVHREQLLLDQAQPLRRLGAQAVDQRPDNSGGFMRGLAAQDLFGGGAQRTVLALEHGGIADLGRFLILVGGPGGGTGEAGGQRRQ